MYDKCQLFLKPIETIRNQIKSWFSQILYKTKNISQHLKHDLHVLKTQDTTKSKTWHLNRKFSGLQIPNTQPHFCWDLGHPELLQNPNHGNPSAIYRILVQIHPQKLSQKQCYRHFGTDRSYYVHLCTFQMESMPAGRTVYNKYILYIHCFRRVIFCGRVPSSHLFLLVFVWGVCFYPYFVLVK